HIRFTLSVGGRDGSLSGTVNCCAGGDEVCAAGVFCRASATLMAHAHKVVNDTTDKTPCITLMTSLSARESDHAHASVERVERQLRSATPCAHPREPVRSIDEPAVAALRHGDWLGQWLHVEIGEQPTIEGFHLQVGG